MSGSKLKAKSRPSKSQPAKKPKAKLKRPKSITPQQFVAAVGAIDDEIQHYNWFAYGKHAFFIDADFPVHIGSAQIIVNIADNEICEMHAADYGVAQKDQAWRWLNPKYRAAHLAEARRRGFKNDTEAWDRVKWVPVSQAKILQRIKLLRQKIAAAAGVEPVPVKKKTRRCK